jgi:hypothetical protein
VLSRTDLCISDADVLIPRHVNSIMPINETVRRNRVLVKKTHIALVGGSWALADFHVMPPLGRSMMAAWRWARHHRLEIMQFQWLADNERALNIMPRNGD